MVRASDWQSRGRGCDFQPFHGQVTTLAKLFTHVPLSLSPSSIIWYWQNAECQPAGGRLHHCHQRSCGVRHYFLADHTARSAIGMILLSVRLSDAVHCDIRIHPTVKVSEQASLLT